MLLVKLSKLAEAQEAARAEQVGPSRLDNLRDAAITEAKWRAAIAAGAGLILGGIVGARTGGGAGAVVGGALGAGASAGLHGGLNGLMYGGLTGASMTPGRGHSRTDNARNAALAGGAVGYLGGMFQGGRLGLPHAHMLKQGLYGLAAGGITGYLMPVRGQ